MHDEMTAHIAQAADRFMARGMSRHDALNAAQREFGPLAALQEHARDARGGPWVDNLRADLKYALRYFARMPLTTITNRRRPERTVDGSQLQTADGRQLKSRDDRRETID